MERIPKLLDILDSAAFAALQAGRGYYRRWIPGVCVGILLAVTVSRLAMA